MPPLARISAIVRVISLKLSASGIRLP